MKISERGQVTIPRQYREQLGLTPDTEIEFILQDGHLVLRHQQASRKNALREIYGSKQFKHNTDELMRMLRG